MKVFTIEVPWPPSVNHYWGHQARPVGKGRYAVHTFLSTRGREFRNAVLKIVRDRLPGIQPSDKRLGYLMTFHAPSRRKFDLSNFAKGIEDALQHAGLYHDDSQFDEVHYRRGAVVRDGKVIMKIWELPGQKDLLEDQCQTSISAGTAASVTASGK